MRRALRSFVIVTGLAVSLAACGSGSSKGSGGNDADGGLTGTPIRFGGLCSSAAAPLFDDSCKAAVGAVFEQYNKKGGYKGRPLEMEPCDASDPANSPACFRRLSDDSGILAFVSNNLDEGIAPVLKAKHMASIGPLLLTEDSATSPNAFPLSLWGGGSSLATLSHLVQSGEVSKPKTIAISIDIPAAQQLLGSVKDLLKSAGGLDNVPVSLSETSFGPAVAKIKAGKYNTVLLSLTETQTQAVLQEAANQGVKGVTFVSSYPCADEQSLKKNAAVNSGLMCSLPFNWDKRSIVKDLFKETGTKPAKPMTYQYVQAYLAGKLTIAALEKVQGEVTRESILAAMKTLTFNDPLMLQPVDFSKPAPDPRAAAVKSAIFQIYKVENGDLKAVGAPVDLFAPTH